jgi:DNA repair protein RadA/Sms
MALLLRLAKSTQIPIWVIGHVTKTGDVAGPRMVEHMVDAVLYLEQAGVPSYRWLRAAKNRFGSCQTVGLYEFTNGILLPSPEGMMDGSANLKQDDLEGCAMAMSVEGQHRAMVSEVQALVVISSSFVGKKTVDGGFSFNRLNLLLGVLQKHCGVFIGKSRDVYVNVVGGSSKKSDSSCLDLAVSMALTSSTSSVPIRGDTAFCAQVGLLGELRTLPSMEPRLLQAQRMGFSRVIVAGNKLKHQHKYGMEYIECPTLKQALELGLTAGLPKRQRRTPGKKKASSKKKLSPDSLEEWELENIIVDDEDDEDDFY